MPDFYFGGSRPLVHDSGLAAELPSGSVLASDTIWYPGVKLLHGWPIDENAARRVSLSYSARQMTITALIGATFDIYVKGITHTLSSPYTFAAHADSTGVWFVYFDAEGDPQVAGSIWHLNEHVPVASIYYNATLGEGIALNELHDAYRDPRLHERLHVIDGTVIEEGFSASGYTLETDSDAGITFAIASGVIRDEDIAHTIAGLSDAGPYLILERTGASGVWTWSADNTLPVIKGTNYPCYNSYSGGAWGRTELTNDSWVNMWVFALPSIATTSIVLVMGQSVFEALADAQAESVASLQWGTMPFQEIAPLYRVSIRARTNYNGTAKCRIEDFARLVGAKGQLSLSTTVSGFLPAPSALASADFNLLTSKGAYALTGTPTNGPRSGAIDWSALTLGSGVDEATQIALSLDASELWFRRRVASGPTWQDWQKTLTEAEGDATYLPLAGGTLTGAVTTDSTLSFTQGLSFGAILFDTDGLKRISYNDGSFQFSLRNGSANIGAGEKYLATGSGASHLALSADSTDGAVTLRAAVAGTAGDTVTWASTLAMTANPVALTFNSNTVWHAGNDGTGSGLDADKLDGNEATAFVRTNADSTIATNDLSFGSAVRQMLNLYSTTHALGVQSATLYARSNAYFAVHIGGTHSDTALDAGSGGVNILTAHKTNLRKYHYDVLAGNVTDRAPLSLDSYVSGAYTITRLNYLELSQPVLADGAAITNACLFSTDAAVGTHKLLDAGSTKTTPGTVNGWIKINVNGTLYYVPMYTSKTT